MRASLLADILAGILVPAAIAEIHRSAQTRAEFKRLHPCPATGKVRGRCPGQVIDHRHALCAGGMDSPDNMQWQTIADAKSKDRWECRSK
jgi:hypothetical protein